jgi:hypothetical protein
VAEHVGAIDTDDYDTFLVWIARHLGGLRDPVWSLMQEAIRIGRPITEAHAERIMEEAGPPRFWSDDACAYGIKLTYAVRQALQITSVGSIDKTKAQRTELRKKRNRNREALRRRAAGAKPRRKSLSRTRPWLDEGISRRTWERHRAKSGGDANSCAAPLYPHQPPSPQSGHRDARDANSCAPPFLLPQHKLASITTRTSPSQLQRREIMRTDWLTVLGIPVLAERKWSGEQGRKQASGEDQACGTRAPSLISATPETHR